MTEIKDWVAEANKEREGHVTAFALIEDQNDWKAPIRAFIDKVDFERCKDACVFFTATDLVVTGEADGDKFRVESVGYRAGPAGP